MSKTDGNAASERANRPKLDIELAEGEWVERIVAPGETSSEDESPASKTKWRHAGLEAVLSRGDPKARLRMFARSNNAIVSANAAIGLAWLGDDDARLRLIKAARDKSLALSMRSAAIEAIGKLDSENADNALEKLAEDVGQFRGPGRSRYVPELHAEIIRVMGGRLPDRHTSALIAALGSPAAAVRLEAVSAFLSGNRNVPRELVDRTFDDVATVRATAIRALAASQNEQAQVCAKRALADYDLSVRLAAIEAIGMLPASENEPQLKVLAKNSADVVRAAAVKALARRRNTSAVVQAAQDKSWRVRCMAAECLAILPFPDREPLARALLVDASLEVQRRMVQSLRQWPDAEAIPILLIAMESSVVATSREAAAQLSARWPAAAELSVRLPRERMLAEVHKLRDVWQQNRGNGEGVRPSQASSHDPAGDIDESHVRALRGVLLRLKESPQDSNALDRSIAELMAWPQLEAELNMLSMQAPELLDDPLYRRVLAHRNPVFAAIERLTSPSLQERREASRELAVKARDRALSHLALLRLRLLLEKETDPLIWSDLLSIIDGDDSETAADLAGIAASHPSNDIRRRACAYFGKHPSPRGADLLLNSLGDSDPSVVRDALRSLGEARNLADLGPPDALLASPDSSLRREAAVVLSRFGSPAGWRALLRMTHHQDAAVRRRAAIALGTFGEQAASANGSNNDLTPTPARDQHNENLRREIIGELVRLLDDHGDIRRAALTSLRQIIGELPKSRVATDAIVATANVLNGSDEEVRRWKDWYRSIAQ